MSSIFKALKKLEQEQGGGNDLAPRLTSVLLDQPAREKRRLRPAFLIAAGFSVGAVLAYVGLQVSWQETAPKLSGQEQLVSHQDTTSVQNEGRASTENSLAGMDARQEAPATKVSPESPAEVQVTRQRPAPAKLSKSPRQGDRVAKPVAAVVARKPLKDIPAESTIDEVRFVAEEVAVAGVVPPATRPAPVSKQIGILVSEIFYQPGGQESMAVVNDLPVMEGTQIDDVTVMKILPDSVLFLVRGEQVEITLQHLP